MENNDALSKNLAVDNLDNCGTVDEGLDADGTIDIGFCGGGMVGKVLSDGEAVCIVVVCWIGFSSISLPVNLRRLLLFLSENVCNRGESGAVDVFVGCVFFDLA